MSHLSYRTSAQRTRSSSFHRLRDRQLHLEQLEERRVLAATIDFSGDYVLENWQQELISDGTTTITPASGAADEATFAYGMTLQPPGFIRERTVDFLVAAAETGTVTFDYQFTGNSNFFQARALFDVVSDGGATPIVDQSTSGNFSLTGSASFIAQQGRNFGFRIGGSNGDSNRDIDGELRITNITFHDEILSPIVVDTDSDIDDGDLSPGNLSIREAIRLANEAAGADTITFDESLAGSTITLTEGQLEIRSSMTINGLGAKDLTVSGDGVSRVFSEEGGGERIITITDLTIADGMGSSTDRGGAFFSNGGDVTFRRVVMTGNGSGGNEGTTIVMAFGRLEINDSAIVDNLPNGVGTIRLQDNQTTITNTTISGNAGRGISFFSPNDGAPDRLTLSNVTLADNANDGIEIVANAGEMLFEYDNTIFAGNAGPNIAARGSNLAGLTITSLGHNLLDDTPTGDAAHAAAVGDQRNTNPLLGPLQDNGGPTPTHALLAGSPAIDAGNSLLTTDQRGERRPADVATVANVANASDIGAFELQIPTSADFNGNALVDGADFLAWQRGFGTANAEPVDGDGDFDGDVDNVDLSIWNFEYGAQETLQAAASPARDPSQFADLAIAQSFAEESGDEIELVIAPAPMIAMVPLSQVAAKPIGREASVQGPPVMGEKLAEETTEIAWMSDHVLEAVFGS